MQGKSGFRIDLLDPTTLTKTGDFPITSATTVQRRRVLDRIGSWSFDMSVADPALPDIEGKVFDVYWMWGEQTFSLGQCTYLNHVIRTGGGRVDIQAAGDLHDLTRQTVLERTFDGASDDVNDVLSEIVPLRSGWALGDVDTITTAAPLDFWYEPIFDGVVLLAETFGYHFREGTTSKTLDFGAMGTSSGVLAVGGDQELPIDVYHNEDLCQISELSVVYQRDDVVNQLIPFGGAVGVATIDLSEVTVEDASYPVQNAALPNGEDYYYIEDTTSQSTYGLTSRRFLRKDLRPIVNTAAAREYAANILYQAALASLLKLKDRQTVYELSVVGLQPGQVKVGDKINVLYRGWADTQSGAQLWLDVDHATSPGQGKAFWVLEIDETFGDGVTTRLVINENDVAAETDTDLLAGVIKRFEQSQIHAQPSPSRYTVGPYTKRTDTSVDAEFSFTLGSETLNIWYIKIRIVGEPLKSSVTTSGAGSAHTHGINISADGSHAHGPFSIDGSALTHIHSMAVYAGGLGDNATVTAGPPSSMYHGGAGGTRYVDTGSGGGHIHTAVTTSTQNHSHTGQVTGAESAHTHGMTYGIHEDATRPDDLTIKVNGSTVASGVTLSAPDYDYELDITSDILAAGTLQQEHVILIETGAGQGEIVFQAQVLAVIQPILIS